MPLMGLRTARPSCFFPKNYKNGAPALNLYLVVKL